MRRSWIGIVALALTGACTSVLSPDTPVESEAGPADYQPLVAKALAELKDTKGPFDVSPLRRTRLAQPGDWMVCVRATVQERPTYLAFFMREGQVFDRRIAVLIDECAQERFQPLPEHRPPPPEAKPSSPDAKSKSPPEAKSSPEAKPSARPSP